jgi:mRNA interferase MazF
MTTGSHPAPFRIPIRFGGKSGLVLLDQIRAIDKARLSRRLGKAPASTLTATLGVLQEMFSA